MLAVDAVNIEIWPDQGRAVDDGVVHCKQVDDKLLSGETRRASKGLHEIQ